jgi:hypothetical protein
VISQTFSSKFLHISISVAGDCIHLILKICQTLVRP